VHGWVADLGALDRALKAAAEQLDHGMLNEHAGLELPTLEHLCLWFVSQLKPEWPGLCRITGGASDDQRALHPDALGAGVEGRGASRFFSVFNPRSSR
jgi:6-pyruvoyl-tetrahydropterin synthase